MKTDRGKILSVAIEKGRREAEGAVRGRVGGVAEDRQTEGGKVHPVDGGPAPLVFCEGETLHNVY